MGHARCICRSLYASRGPGAQCSSGRSKPHDLGAGGSNLNRLAGQINDPDMAAFRSQEQEGALALPLLYWYRYVRALCLHPEATKHRCQRACRGASLISASAGRFAHQLGLDVEVCYLRSSSSARRGRWTSAWWDPRCSSRGHSPGRCLQGRKFTRSGCCLA